VGLVIHPAISRNVQVVAVAAHDCKAGHNPLRV
jgi:hypothetical protein